MVLSNCLPGKGWEFSVQSARTIGGTARLDHADATPGNAAPRLTRRPSAAADHDFLLTLFAESRPELALLPEAARPALTRMQFGSQRGQYRSSWPDAVDWIVEFDHGDRVEPVGRCYVWRGRREHRLLDLAIRRQWRRHGLAGTVLARLCAEAAEVGVPLRLSVWRANQDALRLYHRNGFVVDEAGSGAGFQPAGYLQLRWSAGGQR